MKLTLSADKKGILTIEELDNNFSYLQNISSQGGIEKNPNESILTKIPNNNIGWFDSEYSPLYQNIEIESEEVTANILSISEDTITIDIDNTIYTWGDTITISGSSIDSNNGVWKVKTNFEKRTQIYPSLTNDQILRIEDNPIGATVTWKKRKLVGLSWPQAQLEDGTVIWETYDNQNWDDEIINGYWVALKPNKETGEYEYLSHLKMSENFWRCWYEYTAKVEGEPLSVILTTLINGYGERNYVGSIKFKLSIVDNQLVLEETIYDLEKTWLALYSELLYELTSIEMPSDSLNFNGPPYCSDNDWYGMMFGPEMGWYWTWSGELLRYTVGYNMLTGETKIIDIFESISNIKNIYYSHNPEGLVQSRFSHSKYGLVFALQSSDRDRYKPTAMWSPNFTNVDYATILDIRSAIGDGFIFTGGNIYPPYLPSSWSINNDCFVGSYNYLNRGGFSFFRKKLDDPSSKAEYSDIETDIISGNYNTEWLFYWQRENSLIITNPNLNDFRKSEFFLVWRNDKPTAEYIKSPFMYPNMIEDNKLTDWSNYWTISSIVSLTDIYNKNTL